MTLEVTGNTTEIKVPLETCVVTALNSLQTCIQEQGETLLAENGNASNVSLMRLRTPVQGAIEKVSWPKDTTNILDLVEIAAFGKPRSWKALRVTWTENDFKIAPIDNNLKPTEKTKELVLTSLLSMVTDDRVFNIQLQSQHEGRWRYDSRQKIINSPFVPPYPPRELSPVASPPQTSQVAITE